MTQEKLSTIKARQMHDAEKRARADYVIDTGLPLEETKVQVDKLLESLKNRAGNKFGLWRRFYEEHAG
jgi:dephospho-CoA kinase